MKVLLQLLILVVVTAVATATTKEEVEEEVRSYRGWEKAEIGDVHIAVPDEDAWGQAHVIHMADSTIAENSIEEDFPELHDLAYVGKPPRLEWAFATGGVVDSSPFVDPDTGVVYVGSRDQTFYAFEPSGELKWSFECEGSIYISSPTVHDGVVYFGSRDHHVSTRTATTNKTPPYLKSNSHT
jgi:outer membrane protein assembly factor BamB